jgi:predicted anti-sigma-YlaC factor YlaD
MENDMNHENIKNHFQAWHDGLIDDDTRKAIDLHLSDCQQCREYYESLSILLGNPDDSLLPRLKPDPYLPSRIRAIVDERTRQKPDKRTVAPITQHGLRGWITASCVSVAVAITLGVFLGKSFAPSSTASTDNAMTLAEEYYEALSPGSIFDNAEEIIKPEAKDVS